MHMYNGQLGDAQDRKKWGETLASDKHALFFIAVTHSKWDQSELIKNS